MMTNDQPFFDRRVVETSRLLSNVAIERFTQSLLYVGKLLAHKGSDLIDLDFGRYG